MLRRADTKTEDRVLVKRTTPRVIRILGDARVTTCENHLRAAKYNIKKLATERKRIVCQIRTPLHIVCGPTLCHFPFDRYPWLIGHISG